MHALDLLGDPVRRRILEVLADGARPAGAVGEVIYKEFGISQSAVSQHLRTLRDAGFVSATIDGRMRIYSLEPDPLREVDAWFARFRALWAQPLDALATEIARGKRR